MKNKQNQKKKQIKNQAQRKKKKKTLFFSVLILLLLISSGLSLFLIQEDKKTQNIKSIYCTLKGQDKVETEIIYHFQKRQVSQMIIRTQQPFNSDINLKAYQKKMEENNQKYKGFLNKIWSDEKTFMTFEFFDLETLTEKEFQELTGISKKELKKKTRQQIIESIDIMGKGTSFQCE